MDTDQIKEFERLALEMPRFETAVAFLVKCTGYSMKTCVAWMLFLNKRVDKKPCV